MDLIDRIIVYETDAVTTQEALELFAELIRSGQVWQLQGSYGRTASELIENGVISSDGEILKPAPD